MATDIPILLSSPLHQTIATTPPNGLQVPMSSSPMLPSPSQLFAKKSLVKSSIPVREGLVSNRSVTGFTSASTLLRQEQTVETLGAIINKKLKEPVVKNFQERDHTRNVNPIIETNDDIFSGKKAETDVIIHLKSGNDADFAVGDLRTLEKPVVSKPNAKEKKSTKKGKNETQSKIKKGKIIKPGIISGATGDKAELVKAANLLKDSNQTKVSASSKKGQKYPAGREPLELLLVEAVKRRKAWTPVKDTIKGFSPSEPIETLQSVHFDPDQCAPEPVRSPVFDILLDDYKCAQQNDGSMLSLEQTRAVNGEALTKRRKIELVNSAHSIPTAPSKKLKSPEKKRQTITGKAIAPFISAESAAPNLSQYFGALVEEKHKDYSTDAATNVAPPAKASKRKSKPKVSNTTNLRKTIKKSPILLSPETAMRSTKDQDLIFGTCSQLVRDESPTLIKDAQQAAKASELVSNGSFATLAPENSLLGDLKATTEQSSISSFAASRNLWSVAARDSEGSLLNAEIIDLVDTPRPQKYSAMTTLSAVLEIKSPLSNISPESDQWATVEECLLRAPDQQTEFNLTDRSVIEEKKPTPNQSIPRSIAEAALRQRRRSRSPVKKCKIGKNLGEPSLIPAIGQVPNYHGFTTSQLSKDIASYGFKAIKKRTEMIALLERCWESQSRIALQALPTNVNFQAPSANHANLESPEEGSLSKMENVKSNAKATKAKATNSKSMKKVSQPSTTEATLLNDKIPKKPRGRPKKQSLTTPNPDTSIPIHPAPSLLASTMEVVPSKSYPISVPPSPSSSTSNIPSVPPPPLSIQALHGKITQAITTFPPTNSAVFPSFYERILLYEPIVLEDLTAWLNTGGLGRVGVDDEVPAGVVKEWCEKSGVCCFWKADGWRAKR